MRSATAAILAILAIVLIVFAESGGFSSTAGVGGNIGGQAIASGTDSSMPPLPAPKAAPVALVANSGFIPDKATITLSTNEFTFASGTAPTLTIELRGTSNENAVFAVQHALTADSFAPLGGTPLIARHGPTGGSYAALSTQELTALRDTHGAGWYVFTARDGAGASYHLALFIR